MFRKIALTLTHLGRHVLHGKTDVQENSEQSLPPQENVISLEEEYDLPIRIIPKHLLDPRAHTLMRKPVRVKATPGKPGLSFSVCDESTALTLAGYQFVHALDLQTEIDTFLSPYRIIKAYYDELKLQLDAAYAAYKAYPNNDFQLRFKTTKSKTPIPEELTDEIISYNLFRCPIQLTMQNNHKYVIDYFAVHHQWETPSKIKLYRECDIKSIAFAKEVYDKIEAFITKEENAALDQQIADIQQLIGDTKKLNRHDELEHLYAEFYDLEQPIPTPPHSFIGFNIYEKVIDHPIKVYCAKDHKYILDLDSLLQFWEDHPELKHTLFGERIIRIEYEHTLKAELDEYFQQLHEERHLRQVERFTRNMSESIIPASHSQGLKDILSKRSQSMVNLSIFNHEFHHDHIDAEQEEALNSVHGMKQS